MAFLHTRCACAEPLTAPTPASSELRSGEKKHSEGLAIQLKVARLESLTIMRKRAVIDHLFNEKEQKLN